MAPMSKAADWRLTGDQPELSGVPLTWKRYQAYSGNWEHEHCVFCQKKLLDRDYAPWMRTVLDRGSPGHAGFGYTNLHHGALPSGLHWICQDCFTDFEPRFHWPVKASDPDAWPYDPPEPHPRPTQADYDPDRPHDGP